MRSVLVALVMLACGVDDRPAVYGSPGLGSGLSVGDEGGSTSDAGGTEGMHPSGNASDPDTGADPSSPAFDIASPEGSDLPPTQGGCTKVDVVISVDNSGSMTQEVAALQGPVFDSFPQTLLDINNGLDDFQLGLVDACPKPAALHDSG